MSIPTYIIHVSTAHERRTHMDNVISKNHCLNPDFILEGDIKDLSQAVLQKYFSENDMLPAQVSCAYKHILAYEKIIANKNEVAIILEDDIILDENFCRTIQHIINEVTHRKIENFIISLEDSNMKLVKGSEVIKGQFLYKKMECRFTGASLMDYKAAQSLLHKIKSKPLNIPIDWYHNECAKNEDINIYWSYPTIATQGSTMGLTKTLIGTKRTGLYRVLTRKIERFYKKFINQFR